MSEDILPQENDIIFYSTPDGQVHIEVFFKAKLFGLVKRKCQSFYIEIIAKQKPCNYLRKISNSDFLLAWTC